MKTGAWRWRAHAMASVVTVACAVTACGGSGPAPASPPRTGSQHAGRATPSGQSAPTASDPTTLRPTTGPSAAASSGPACVARTLDGLTLAQRVGQLFLVGMGNDNVSSQLTRGEQAYHFGSLLLNKTDEGTAPLAEQTSRLQSLAPSATGGVRLFIAANQEGGQVQQLAGPGFAAMPSALDQGSLSVADLRKAATTWGTDLREAGVNLNLAPVMDVVPRSSAASNAPIGALDREFGYDAAGNGAHGTAFIQGMAAAKVMTVAKHFPGLGRVIGNTDYTADVTDDVTTASDSYLNSFRAAVNAGVPMVMVTLATYKQIDPARLAVFSPVVMRLLRTGIGFTGVIVSDDLGQAAAVQTVPAGTRAISFLNAGGDLIISQSLGPAEQMATAVLAKATADPAFRATVDSAAQQVLTAKHDAGLLTC